MCPFCFATLALVAAGATSAGGLAALAIKVSRNRNTKNETVTNSSKRRNADVDEHDRKAEGSLAG